MWATLWGIWQHCDPQTEAMLLDHYANQLGKLQLAAGDCLMGRGSADERGFGEIESLGYGDDADDAAEIAVSPEAMPPLPWEKRKRRGGG